MVRFAFKTHNFFQKKRDAYNALTSYMLTCLNQHKAALAEWSKAILQPQFFVRKLNSKVDYSWNEHGFKFYLRTFIWDISLADKSL